MSDFAFGPPPEPFPGLPAYLIMQRGPAPDTRFELTAVTSTIGRSANNDITINDPEVSRRHAHILQREQGYAIEDLGSTNGTFVNGQRCVGVIGLHDGDEVDLGDTISLLFRQEPAPSRGMAADDEEDTADLVPVRPPVPPRPTPRPAAVDPYVNVPVETEPGRRPNRALLGCLLAAILLFCCCGGLLLVLDSYAQGQYLYCGGLRPLWEAVLGPFGFNPLCP